MGIKPWYQSKTLWANIISGAVALAAVFGLDLDINAEDQAEIIGGIVAAISAVNIVLRLVTTSKIGNRRATLGSFAPLAVILAALALAACAGSEALPDVTDAVADRVVAVETPEQRALRAGGFAAIASELATDRVFRSDAEDAGEVYMFINRLKAAIIQIRTAGGAWYHADLFDAKRILIVAVGKRLRDRAESLLASGVNFGSALTALTGVGQAAKGAAMLRDVKAMVAAVQSNEMSKVDAWKAVDARIGRNLDRLRPLVVGAAG